MGEEHGGVQSVTKTVEGRRDALWEIYIQYFALWSSHWPGGLIVCVTTILRTVPLTLSMLQLNEISGTMSEG